MKSVEPDAPPRERPEKTRFKRLAVALGGAAILVGAYPCSRPKTTKAGRPCTKRRLWMRRRRQRYCWKTEQT